MIKGSKRPTFLKIMVAGENFIHLPVDLRFICRFIFNLNCIIYIISMFLFGSLHNCKNKKLRLFQIKKLNVASYSIAWR